MKNAVEMPLRDHYLKWQCSIPAGATRHSVRKRQQVINSAVEHLRALAGPAASMVEVRAVYQERGQLGQIAWWDILVVLGFNGPLQREAREKKVERGFFETSKMNSASGGASQSLYQEKKVLLH